MNTINFVVKLALLLLSTSMTFGSIPCKFDPVFEFQPVSDRIIVLAHLNKNSLLAKAGDTIQEGQPIAKVGNSGITTEPLFIFIVYPTTMKVFSLLDKEYLCSFIIDFLFGMILSILKFRVSGTF